MSDLAASRDKGLVEFVADRREALLSMNLDKINAYMRKHGSAFTLPDNDIGWMAVHKARTAATDLPMDERKKSAEWLESRGYQSWGDWN